MRVVAEGCWSFTRVVTGTVSTVSNATDVSSVSPWPSSQQTERSEQRLPDE